MKDQIKQSPISEELENQFRKEMKSPRTNRVPTKVELAKVAQENPFKVNRGSQFSSKSHERGGVGFRN